MNREKIKQTILKNNFKKKSYFSQINVDFGNNRVVSVNKIKNLNDFKDYVEPLENFYNKAFLIYPRIKFSTKNFKTNVDLIFLNSKLKIVKLEQDVKPNSIFDFKLNYYAILILERGFIKVNNLTNISSIKLATFN